MGRASHRPAADDDLGRGVGPNLDGAEDGVERQGDGAPLSWVQLDLGLPRSVARLRVAHSMDHTGGQIDLRRGGPVVDGQHAVPGRQLERHPRPGLRQPVVALDRGRIVGDLHGIGAGRVAGMGDIERVDATLDLEGERCGACGRAVVRHPGAARLRGDFDPASDPRHLQREVMNAAPFGGHGVRRGRVAGLPALDGVLASRDFDFQAGSPSHQRAVEKPPGFRMPRLGRGSEHRGTLAQDDVDVRACPRRLADRDGFGRESRRTDPQRQRSR